MYAASYQNLISEISGDNSKYLYTGAAGKLLPVFTA